MCVRAAVLFADLRGYTRLCEQLAPEAIVPLLNEYFALLGRITGAHAGTIFHMACDGMMVGFGVCAENGDCPAQALRAARAMLKEFETLAGSWRTRFGINVALGVGLHVGSVMAARVGNSERSEYTLIGDAVNVAARLCQRARAGEVLFSGSVKQGLDDEGAAEGARPLPSLSLRGRSEPIEVHCLPCARRLDVEGGKEVRIRGPAPKLAEQPFPASI